MKYINKCLIFIIYLSTLSFFSLSLNAAPAFKFQCNDKKTVGYRMDKSSGQVLSDKWGEESFGSTWNFEYDGVSKEVLIDGKPNFAFFGEDTVIILEYANNGIAQSLWTYAVQLKMDKVVASQVNAAEGMGRSTIKSRVVELNCRRY